MRRHQRLLTFFGALIVFFTFIVKDALRENLKDLVDSLNAAEASAMASNETQMAIVALEAVQNRLDRIVGRGETDPEDRVDSSIAILQTTCSLYLAVVAENSRLIERLPSDVAAKFEERIKGAAKAQEPINARYLELLQRQMPEKQAPESQAQDRLRNINLYTQVVLLTTQIAAQEVEVKSIGREMLIAANGIRQQDERRYRWATWASYVLYALGWGLGLLGRLASVESGAEDE
jgi:hypothetical protein